MEVFVSDCYKAVSAKLKTTNFKILNLQQISLDEINGYLGEHKILEVTIEQNSHKESVTFFVKFPPRTSSQLNFLTEINGIFKERSFFMRYLPVLKRHGIDLLDDIVPECYYVNEAKGVFIFENLKARGFDTLPSRVPLEIEYVKAALVALAKLHASGLVLEEKKKFRLCHDFETELKETFYLGTGLTESALKACKEGVKALVDMIDGGEIFKEKAVHGCDLQNIFTTPGRKFRNTVCHADPWTKNFLFKKDKTGISCIIVDFQTYRYGPPAQDVLAFLYLVTAKKMRDQYLDELLDFYYIELEKNLDQYGFKNVIPRKEFAESCTYFKQFALIQTLTHFQVVILSDEIAAELFEDEAKAQEVLFNDRYEFFKMVCDRDRVFRERNIDAITDLKEFYKI